ncbi:MAG: ABC transporter permease [cyanobacterium endosymbiont of Rhopalodia musculus]|uniref:ABC transporter permease n=1 Tax=cyanobacterium endosymbiont of Epithemia clementina EcSB TaxID=3034674 RepID=UPI0024811316|nr:ABC transporter permease [cyanobacterium endosymbiont of Epithemia clementina EcSB]WGT66750.1 ABC transporter permease [cyanobacterium endosymbiont of Epithemia clementina EcSB]
MNILESFKMSAAMLAANKLQTSLTMLGIIMGNASVIATIGLGQGSQKLANEQLKSLGPNILFVMPGNQKSRRTTLNVPQTLVWEDAQAIASQVSSIKAVAPEINQRQLISYRNQNTNVTLVGTNSEYSSVRDFPVATGRFINQIDLKRNQRVAVIGSEIAQNLSLFLGEKIRINNISFEIVGVMEPKGSFFGINQDESIIIPLTTMANQIVGQTSPHGVALSLIHIEAKSTDTVRAAKFQIENLLRLRHQITTEDDFGVRTSKQMMSIVKVITSGLTIMLVGIASISLIVGGIGVMNIMLVSVTERTPEIGLRKALGATQGDILIQFLIEAVIIAISGGVVGIILGVSILVLIGIMFPLSPVIASETIFLSLGISGGIGLGFGVIPAQRAAKLDPIVALRSS